MPKDITFDARFFELLGLVEKSHASWGLWQAIRKTYRETKLGEEIDRGRHYHELSDLNAALQRTAVSDLFVLFDGRKDTFGFQQYDAIFPERTPNGYRDCLNGVLPKFEKVRVWRNNVTAHNSSSKETRDFVSSHMASEEDFAEVLSCSKKLFFMIAELRYGKGHGITFEEDYVAFSKKLIAAVG